MVLSESSESGSLVVTGGVVTGTSGKTLSPEDGSEVTGGLVPITGFSVVVVSGAVVVTGAVVVVTGFVVVTGADPISLACVPVKLAV